MVGMGARLGRTCKQARLDAGLRMIDIATVAGVDQATISLFEGGRGWRRRTDEIVEAYEQECELEPGELWRRAVGC